jgi:hypothetical protein
MQKYPQVKPIHILMVIVPSLFILTMFVVTTVSFYRTSGITGLDAAKIQQIRIEANEKKHSEHS